MLKEIVAKTRSEVELRKSKIPVDLFDIEKPTRSLKEALLAGRGRALITEIKPASPTQGQIREVDAADVAAKMEAGGANA